MALFLTHNEPPEITNFQRISPGAVGGIGDVNMLPRLRTSCAAMLPVRFDPTALVQEPIAGSNVQDGQVKSYETNGGPARLYDTVWSGRRKRKAVGARFQDLRAPDKAIEPIVVGSNQYSYKNMVATVVNARATGNKFLPLPGEYIATELTRGGLFPRITDIGGDGIVAGGNQGGSDGIKRPTMPEGPKQPGFPALPLPIPIFPNPSDQTPKPPSKGPPPVCEPGEVSSFRSCAPPKYPYCKVNQRNVGPCTVPQRPPAVPGKSYFCMGPANPIEYDWSRGVYDCRRNIKGPIYKKGDIFQGPSQSKRKACNEPFGKCKGR